MKIWSAFMFLMPLIVSLPAQAAEGGWRVSCLADGDTIYMEDLPKSIPQETKIRIASRFPEAVCVFVARAAGDNRPKIDKTAAKKPQATAPVVSAESGPAQPLPATTADPGQATDDSLGQALAAISSGSQPLLSKPDTSGAGLAPQPQFWIQVGAYRSASADDIFADWKRMSGKTNVLQNLTPVIQSGGVGISFLRAGPLSELEAEAICLKANSDGVTCSAVKQSSGIETHSKTDVSEAPSGQRDGSAMKAVPEGISLTSAVIAAWPAMPWADDLRLKVSKTWPKQFSD